MKYNYSDIAPTVTIDIRKMQLGNQSPNLSALPVKNPQGTEIKEEKKKDLQSLMVYLPENIRSYYEDIVAGNNTDEDYLVSENLHDENEW